MTKAQKAFGRKVLDAAEGAYLRYHLKLTGTECVRLLTADHRPVANMSRKVFERMHSFFMKAQGRVGNIYLPNELLKPAVERKRQPKAALPA